MVSCCVLTIIRARERGVDALRGRDAVLELRTWTRVRHESRFGGLGLATYGIGLGLGLEERGLGFVLGLATMGIHYIAAARSC